VEAEGCPGEILLVLVLKMFPSVQRVQKFSTFLSSFLQYLAPYPSSNLEAAMVVAAKGTRGSLTL
jgi:hypothetical protein